MRKKLLSRLIEFVKKRGAIWFGTFVLFCVGVTFDSVIIPKALKITASAWSENVGISMEASGWAIDWIDPQISGKNLVVYSDIADNPVIEIDKATVRFSVFKFITRGWRQSIKELVLEGADLHLQKDFSGTWNWESIVSSYNLINGVNRAGTQSKQAAIILDKIVMRNMHVGWHETVLSAQGDSSVNSDKAVINIDDINVLVSDVTWPFRFSQEPQKLTLKGRLGGGELAIELTGEVFAWQHDIRDRSRMLWRPEIRGKISTINVDAASLWRLLPTQLIAAESGKISGVTLFTLGEDTLLSLSTNLELENVGYSLISKGQKAQTKKIVEVNGFSSTEFSGYLSDKFFQPLAVLISNVAEKSLKHSDDEFRIISAKQTTLYQRGLTKESNKQLQEERTPTVQDVLSSVIGYKIADNLTNKIGKNNANDIGNLVAHFISQQKDQKTKPKVNKSQTTSSTSQEATLDKIKSKVSAFYKKVKNSASAKSPGSSQQDGIKNR